MAERIVTLKALGAGTWSTTVKTVSIPNWPLTTTKVSLSSTSSGIGPGGTSFEVKGTAKTPATTTVTIQQTRGYGGNYQTYYLQSWSPAIGLIWEDPINTDDIMTILTTMAPKIDAISTRVTNDLPQLITKSTSIETKLNDSTNGLTAIKSAINTIDSIVDTITLNVTSVKTLAEGKSGFAALKSETASLLSNINSSAHGLAAVKGKVDAVTTALGIVDNKVTELADTLSLEGNLTEDIALIKSRLNVLRFILNGTLFGSEQ